MNFQNNLHSRIFLPGMIERDRGHLINISSVSAHDTYAGGSTYTVINVLLIYFFQLNIN